MFAHFPVINTPVAVFDIRSFKRPLAPVIVPLVHQILCMGLSSLCHLIENSDFLMFPSVHSLNSVLGRSILH